MVVDRDVVEHLRAARAKDRGYASFFGWSIDRGVEERAVAATLAEALEASGETPFRSITSRPRGGDPPDCEALDEYGRRIAIELTELVDGNAIRAYKAGDRWSWANWTEGAVRERILELSAQKLQKFGKLRDGPYEGGYFIIIYTDEPMIDTQVMSGALSDLVVQVPSRGIELFVLQSYCPKLERYPFWRVAVHT